MTAVPLGASLAMAALGRPYGPRLAARYHGGGGLLPPGLAAEEVARRWSLSRPELDRWAYDTQQRAWRAHSGRPLTSWSCLQCPVHRAGPEQSGARAAIPGSPISRCRLA